MVAYILYLHPWLKALLCRCVWVGERDLRNKDVYLRWSRYCWMWAIITTAHCLFMSTCKGYLRVRYRRASSDFNENQPKQGRKIFYLNHEQIVAHIPKFIIFIKLKIISAWKMINNLIYFKINFIIEDNDRQNFLFLNPSPPHEARSRFLSGCIW